MTKKDKVTVDDIIGLVDCEPTDSVEEVRKLRGRENITEKRYNVWDIDGTIFLEDHKEGSYHIGQVGNVDINCLNDIANRLNDLTDENKQLKKDCTVLIYHNQEYRKENEQLKDRIDNYNTAFKKLQDLTERKINENEQLKADKQSLIDFIRKEFPKSHKHILEGFE